MTGVNTVQASRMSVNGRLSHLQGLRVSKIITLTPQIRSHHQTT